MTQNNPEILVVGAGAGGLTAALACANAGKSVGVVERRLDPASEEAAELLAQGGQLLAAADFALQRGRGATDILVAAGKLRAQVWGTRQRTIILDTASLAYLKSLGVDISNFPLLQKMDIDWGPAAPKLCVRYVTRDRHLENVAVGRLDHRRSIMQRDWAVQTSIADLESALLNAAEANPLINVRFGSAASHCEQTANGVQVRVGADLRQYGLLVIADGGGSGSLASHLGITRKSLMRESLDVVVFSTTDKCEYSAVYGEGFVSPGGWTGVGSNGALLTVDVRSVPGASTDSAYAVARKLGIRSPLAEAPMRGTFAIDRATQLVHGSRVVLVGDAAMRGSPLFALGIQHTMLWSQTVAELATKIDTTNAPQALIEYERTAEELVQSRLQFEVACLQVLDQNNAQQRSFARALGSPSLLSAITVDEFEFSTGRQGAYLALCVNVDFRKLVMDATDPGPEIRALQGLGRAELRVRARFQSRNGVIVAHLTPDQELTFTSDIETIKISHGQLRIARSKAGWSVRLENTAATRNSCANERFETPLGKFILDFPDAFLNSLSDSFLENLKHLRTWRQGELELNFKDRSELRWGPVNLRFHQRPQARLSLIARSAVTRLRLRLTKGYVEPLAFSNFLRSTKIVATRCSPDFRAIPSNLDSVIDSWARLAGVSVTQLDIDFHPDGTGAISFYLRVSQLRLTADLTAVDLVSVQSELVQSSHFADFLKTSRSPLHSARAHL